MEEKALQQAIQMAKKKADRLAKGFGVKIKSVYAISDIDFDDLGPLFMRGDAGDADKAEVDDKIFQPSTITINTTIRVIYRLEAESIF